MNPRWERQTSYAGYQTKKKRCLCVCIEEGRGRGGRFRINVKMKNWETMKEFLCVCNDREGKGREKKIYPYCFVFLCFSII